MDILGNMTLDEIIYIAKDPNTTTDLLRVLSKDSSWKIKAYVAYNPNTPEDTLQDLVQDKNWEVRASIVENPQVSIKVLLTLYEHEKNLKKPDSSVIKGLYQNKKLPYVAKVILETLFEQWVEYL